MLEISKKTGPINVRFTEPDGTVCKYPPPGHCGETAHKISLLYVRYPRLCFHLKNLRGVKELN